MKLLARIKHVFLLSLVLTMLVAGACNIHANADGLNSLCPKGMSELDCNAIINNWINWVPNSGACSVSSDSASILGSDTPSKIYNYLIQITGLSPIGVSGIMGNMFAESSYDMTEEQVPGSWNDMSDESNHAVGLVQWDGGRRPAMIKYAESQGLTVQDLKTSSDKNLKTQLDYLQKELSGSYASTVTAVKGATSPEDAADKFEAGYEKAGIVRGGIRETAARAAYNKYGKNGTTSDGVPAPGSSGGSCGSTSTTSGFTFYNQCDPKWSSHPYDGGTMCENACGPTAMAMIVTNLGGKTVLPDTMSDWYTSHGLAAKGGTSWDGARQAAEYYGLKATPIGVDAAKITAAVKAGGMVTIAGMGSDLPFTTAGHFIVIRAIAADGKWLIADPYNVGRHVGDNTKEWDPQVIMAGILGNGGTGNGSGFVITK